MDDEVPRAKPPRSWVKVLDRADADMAAGRVMEGVVIDKMLNNALERLSHRSISKK